MNYRDEDDNIKTLIFKLWLTTYINKDMYTDTFKELVQQLYDVHCDDTIYRR